MTTFPEREHGATGARVAARLREEILDGRLAPGSRITQEDIAEEHGASRVPVREALRLLAGEGLVTLRANAGAWVSQLALVECVELYQARERLEPLLVGMNTALLEEAEIDRLAQLAQEMEDTADAEAFLERDRDFHFITFAAADTVMLQETVVGLWNRTHHYRRAFVREVQRANDAAAHHDHHLIAAAIRRRDAEEAERVVAMHIRRTRLELSRHPEIFTR